MLRRILAPIFPQYGGAHEEKHGDNEFDFVREVGLYPIFEVHNRKVSPRILCIFA